MTTQGNWRLLCEAVSTEKDPERLIKLVQQLNRALEEREVHGRLADQKESQQAEAP